MHADLTPQITASSSFSSPRRRRSEEGRSVLLACGDGAALRWTAALLRQADYDVTVCESADTCLRIARQALFTVTVLVDPIAGEGTIALTHALRAQGQAAGVQPLVVIVCKSSERQAVVPRLMVADDCLYGPQVGDEEIFLARLDAVCRRNARSTPGPAPATHGTLRFGEVQIIPDTFEVTVRGVAIDLTVTEFRVLCLLARRPGWVLSPKQIRAALQPDAPTGRNLSVKTHIYMVRQKLGDQAAHIETVRGMGYRINADAATTHPSLLGG